MATTQKRINKFLSILSEFNFSGADFEDIIQDTSSYDKFEIRLKDNQKYRYFWKTNKNDNHFCYWPSGTGHPVDKPNIKHKNEVDSENDAIKKFRDWLKQLREELDAELENKFIKDPFFFNFKEEELDKPFTAFQKALYLAGTNKIILRVESSTIREKKKKAIIKVVQKSKLELESTPILIAGEPIKDLPTKRSWLKTLVKGLRKVGVWASITVASVVVSKPVEKYLYPEEQAQVVYIIHQSFHFNPSNPLLEAGPPTLLIDDSKYLEKQLKKKEQFGLPPSSHVNPFELSDEEIAKRFKESQRKEKDMFKRPPGTNG